MPPKRKLRVFLNYASQDKPLARALYRKLTSETWIDPWMDEEKLAAGQNWPLEIDKAIESSDAIVVCVSSTSITKEGYLQKELRRVLDIASEKLHDAIFVIPLRLDDCKPPRQLRDKQYLDYFPASKRAAAFDRLKASLRIRKDSLGI
jgi:TIR domain-containing protein